MLYFRTDQHTVNTVTAYHLGEANFGTDTTFFEDDGSVNYGNQVWNYVWSIKIVHADGSKTTLAQSDTASRANRICPVSGFNPEIPPNTGAMRSNTWDCPATQLKLTDALEVVLSAVAEADPWINQGTLRTWITPQLGWSGLKEATWTIWRGCHYYSYYNPPPFLAFDLESYVHYGSAALPSRIEVDGGPIPHGRDVPFPGITRA